jgi:hypothetical protein
MIACHPKHALPSRQRPRARPKQVYDALRQNWIGQPDVFDQQSIKAADINCHPTGKTEQVAQQSLANGTLVMGAGCYQNQAIQRSGPISPFNSFRVCMNTSREF